VSTPGAGAVSSAAEASEAVNLDTAHLFSSPDRPEVPVGNLQAPTVAPVAAPSNVGGPGSGAISNTQGVNLRGPSATGQTPAAPAGSTAGDNTGSLQPPVLQGLAAAPAAPAHAAPMTPAAASGFARPFYYATPISPRNGASPDASTVTYSPTQINQAYGINLLSQNGTGETIYIVDAYNDPNIAGDVAKFDAGYNSGWTLPPLNLTVHKMSSRISNNSSWGVEESLDVEWAHAIAPQASIVLVEATSSSNANLFAAVNYATNSGATIVSMSWGGTDASGDKSYNTDFEHSGVTYIASSGDTGAAVEYPAASPYVLSIGGTTLTLNSNNGYSSESAWADGGGGVSKYEALPGYQSSYGITNSGRSIPDVAWDADPNTGVFVYDSYVRGGGGWYDVGGTSVGAPSWAGVVALADQGRSSPLTTDSLTTSTEYDGATGSVYATNYHDITTGTNGHPAGPGYDLATGVGSPQANNLVPWMNTNS
jgi:subtilase family serine protease